MSLHPDKLEKPFRKLRKLLKNMPKRLSPEQVHTLRTGTRRLEAVMHALMLDRKRDGRRLLAAVAPIRKKAGKVRDMDVLTGFASTLAKDGEDECLIQLLEHLGARRQRFARQLRGAIVRNRKKTRLRLKEHSRLIDKNLTATKETPGNKQWPADAMAIALQLSAELAAWPGLKADNLHPYRLQIKELRYVLQLADRRDPGFVGALGEVKDAIGEWHDWSELAAITSEVLDHRDGCKLLKQIRSITAEKLDRALSLALRLRKKYLGGETGHVAGRNGRRLGLKKPVVITSARLVA